MSLRDRLTTRMSAQLGHPRGLPGRLIGRGLNRSNRASIAAAVTALSARPDAVLADIGFGGGIGLQLLLDRMEEVGEGGRVIGVELSETMLAGATRRFAAQVCAGHLELHQASVEHLPLPDATLDGAITVNTIYFSPDLTPAFAELRRVLRPNGRLVVGLGDPQAMAAMPFTRGFHLRPVTEVVHALSSAGLAVVEHRRVGDGDEAAHLLIASPEQVPCRR